MLKLSSKLYLEVGVSQSIWRSGRNRHHSSFWNNSRVLVQLYTPPSTFKSIFGKLYNPSFVDTISKKIQPKTNAFKMRKIKKYNLTNQFAKYMKT